MGIVSAALLLSVDVFFHIVIYLLASQRTLIAMHSIITIFYTFLMIEYSNILSKVYRYFISFILVREWHGTAA